MSVNKLLQRQWVGYSMAHQDRTNLSVHLFAVPLFMVGTLAALYGLIMLSPLVLIIAASGIMVSFFCKDGAIKANWCNQNHSRTCGVSSLESSSNSG
jgi:hypothetical protein